MLSRVVDLKILGESIRSLPPSQWKERMFFSGFKDNELRAHTGSFPATLRTDKTTHPVFILGSNSISHVVCPCSSKGSRKKQRYIAKGCALEMKNHVMDRDSFLVERYRFTVPLDGRLTSHLQFRGVVPATCIRGGR